MVREPEAGCQTASARGASGTVYLGYDGLNRPLWRNTTNSPTGAYVSYTYDTGTNGIGRLSSEQFNVGKSLGVGSYAYSYDARGQMTGLTAVVDGSSSPFSFGYNDAGQPTSVGYADGTYVCDAYDPTSGALSTVSVTAPNASAGCQSSGQTTLASGLAYGGDAGASGLVTGASVNAGNGSTYTYAASYDDDLRLLSSGLSLASSGATLYQVQPGYDATSNVTSVSTTLGTGSTTSTDQQSFCYDEQNRLIWASSQTANGPNNPGTTTPCASNTAGTLTGQGTLYTASYSYDTLDRLTSGPANGGSSYTYGDAAHLHAATSTSGGYSASYDAAGNMTCRAPTSSTTCAGTPTGAQLTYDNEGRLATWQNAPSNPTSSTSTLYDGAGNRVEQLVTNGAATTTVTYIGALEELSTTAGVTTTTTSYAVGGKRIAQAVNGAFSYLGSDGLGSAEVALDGSGNAQASVLYDPYGDVRYSSGTMPGSYGYTGQRADAATGLDYYHARYYDALAGQFTSADSVAAGGLNRYAYVAGNPETATDPTGHRVCSSDGSECSGRVGGGSAPPPPSPPPTGGCKTNCGSKAGSGACNPDSPNASGACTKLAYNVTKPNGIRDNALKSLQTGAYIKLIVGYLLVVASDVVELVSGTILSRLEALADLVTTVLNSILPLMGQVVQNLLPQFHDAYENVLHFVSHFNGVLSIIQAAIGYVKQGNWLLQATANVAIQIATDAEAPVPGILWTLARSFFGPALTNYLDAGAHFLIRSGYDDLAQWQQEQNMGPIPWCEQYGNGVCGTIPMT